MAIITYGSNFKNLISCIDSNEELLNTLLQAIENNLVPLFNNDTKGKYESTNYRLQTIFTGILSFLTRYKLNIIIQSCPFMLYSKNEFIKFKQMLSTEYFNTSKEWFTILISILDKKSQIYFTVVHDKTNCAMDNSILLHNIHLKIIGNMKEITLGLKSELKWIIGTDFERFPFLDRNKLEHFITN